MNRWLKLGLPALLALLLIGAALIPSVREKIQQHFIHSEREVLATAEGDLFNNGSHAKVIKYRIGDLLYVEALKMAADGSTTLVDRILLPDHHDGMFNLQGHVTRLAIADINNDGKKVLLAPTFDAQLVPHLNVFSFNSDTGRIEPYSPK